VNGSNEGRYVRSYQSDLWSIDLPTGWEAETDDKCTSIQASPSFGLLQISAARKPDGIVTDQDLNDFTSSVSPTSMTQVSTAHLNGLTLERRDEGFYWREWWLRGGSTLIYATYNVRQSMKYKEQEHLQEMIESLREI
jgi:hypothetical protein